jgi:hypothetical protein
VYEDKEIVNHFNRRFGNLFSKRKVNWNENLVPMFRYLIARVRACSIANLDTYEYLANDSCTKLSKRFTDLQNEIDSATEKVLKEIRMRRDKAERKVKESRTRVGPFERETKEEKFPPE